MALKLMQTIKGEKVPKGRVLHQVNKGNWSKCYKNAIIDGAENVCITDIVSRSMPSYLKESRRL